MTETRYGTTWWTGLDDGRVRCDVCPRACATRRAGRPVLRAHPRRRPDRLDHVRAVVRVLRGPHREGGPTRVSSFARAKWSCHSASSSGAMPASRSA